MPRGIFLDAVGAKRGIDGDGNRSGEKNPRIGYEEGARSRQHERHASAGGHTTPGQLRGAAVSSGIELAEGQRTAAFPGITVVGDQQVRALGVVRGAIPQHPDERLGGEDSSVRSCPVQLLSRYRSSQHRAGFHIVDGCSWSGQNGARQILRSIGLRSHAVRQTDVECRFQSRQQFHSLQAAESQVAVELRVGIEQRQGALAPQFIEQTTDYIQDALAHGRAVELSDGSGHRTHEGVGSLPREATTS